MKHSSVVTMMALTIVLVSGCQMTKPLPAEEPVEMEASIFDFEGLPSSDYYVGGGFVIRYRAKEDGVLYIAEDDTKRLLATISLAAGEKHEIVYDINDEDMAANLAKVGIDPLKAMIKVYFVPKKLF